MFFAIILQDKQKSDAPIQWHKPARTRAVVVHQNKITSLRPPFAYRSRIHYQNSPVFVTKNLRRYVPKLIPFLILLWKYYNVPMFHVMCFTKYLFFIVWVFSVFAGMKMKQENRICIQCFDDHWRTLSGPFVT